jgi:serine phosphatase RsbU (regulator of sigma subunit)/CHASE2 domain-containing sensor protein
MLRLLLNARTRLAVVAALGAAFAILALRFGWFAGLDAKVYDLGLSIRPAAKSATDVVVVAIDQYSRDRAFAPPAFPISAHVAEHARVIHRLKAAGARVIDLDVLFDQMGPDLDVTPLVEALDESGNVCLAGAIEKRTIALRDDGSAIAEERLVIPSDRIPDSLYCVGLVNMPLDADGVARRGSYGQVFQGTWLSSMPAALAASFMGGRADGTRGDGSARAARDSWFYIDYRSAGLGVTTIPYADVLTGDGWQDLVRDRVVLIGVTENSISDVYEVPLRGLPGAERGNKLPGVLVLAYAAQTLVGGSIVPAMPRSGSLLVGLALALGTALLALRQRLWVSAGLVVALGVGLMLAGVLTSGLRLTVLPAGLALSVTLVTAVTGLFVSYLHTRLKSQVQQQRLDEISADLGKAAEIQHSLQPETMPVVEGAELAGFQVPCKEIGGDYYDVIDLSGGRVGLLIADVCGKGVPAALLMSNLQSSVRQIAPQVSSAKALVTQLNTVASRVFTDGRFVTLLYGILDVPGLEFSYCSAGHMPPLVCASNGEVRQLELGGLPVGLFPDFQWEEHSVRLAEGDLIFTYTDGLSEASAGTTGELFGLDRIKSWLSKNHRRPLAEINHDIVREARGFSGSEHLDDDITLLAARVNT